MRVGDPNENSGMTESDVPEKFGPCVSNGPNLSPRSPAPHQKQDSAPAAQATLQNLRLPSSRTQCCIDVIDTKTFDTLHFFVLR